MKFAQIVGGIAVNVVDSDPAELFHPDMMAANPFIEVPDDVCNGWLQDADGTWRADAAPVETPSDDSDQPVGDIVVTVQRFKALWTLIEEAEIRALGERDAVIRVMLSRLDDPRTVEVNITQYEAAIELLIQRLECIPAADKSLRLQAILHDRLPGGLFKKD